MNSKGQSRVNVGIVVSLFIIIIIALALIPTIFNTQSLMTDKQTVTNDSITYAGAGAEGQINTSYQMNITKAQDDWRSTSCEISGYSLTNSTGDAYTETTDYVFTGAYGNFTLLNTATVNASTQSDNLTYVSYTYCDEGYNKDAGSRGVARIIGLFTVLVLLGAAFFGLKQTGMLD